MIDGILIFGFFQLFVGFYWKWGFWCIPTPDDCLQASWQGFCLFWKIWPAGQRISGQPAGRLRNSDGWWNPDFQVFPIFYWFYLKIGVLVHPHSGRLFVGFLAGAFFFVESHFWEKTCFFVVIFKCLFIKIALKWYKKGELLPELASWTLWILVGALNAWNDRPKVVPWPILFEKVVPKRQINHH